MSIRSRSPKRTIILCGALAVLVMVALYFREGVQAAYLSTSAQKALGRGEFTGAIAHLDQVAPAQRGPQWYFLRAKAERRSGNVQAAEASLKAASDLGWHEDQITRQRLLLKAQSNIREVEAELTAAISSGGTDEEAEEAYEAMARGYLSALRFKESAECLKFWSEWQPNNPIPHVWKGMLHDRTENPEFAIQAYQEALKCDPTNTEARLKLAKIYLDQLQVEAAAALFEQCLAQEGTSQEALLGMADCKRRLGEHSKAKSLLHDVLVLDLEPYQAAEALGTLAKLAQEEGLNAQAVHLFSQSVALNPNDFSNRLAYAAALLQVGQKTAAEAERKTARAMSERHNRLENVIRKVTQRPLDADLRVEAGSILLEQGMPAAGIMWLETALQIDPEHPAANQALAQFKEKTGKDQQGAKHQGSPAVSARRDPAMPSGGAEQ